MYNIPGGYTYLNRPRCKSNIASKDYTLPYGILNQCPRDMPQQPPRVLCNTQPGASVPKPP